MGLDIARKDDTTFGTCSFPGHGPQPGIIFTACSKTKAGGKLIARFGDTVKAACGHTGTIDKSSASVITEGKGTARKTDTFTGIYSGSITGGLSSVKVG